MKVVMKKIERWHDRLDEKKEDDSLWNLGGF